MKSQESIHYWFKVLEERGEFSSFTVIEETNTGQKIESDFFHGDMDGIGGFLSIMKQRGETDFLLPELPKRPRPHSFVYTVNFLRYLIRIPFYSPKWKIKETWLKRSEKPLSRAWGTLSKAETEKVWAKAKALGVSRNTYFLYHLDLAVKPYLKPSLFPRYWLIPVNLRTDFSDHSGNITGFIDARITENVQILELDQKLKRSLLRGEALGGHVGITIGRFIGPVLLRILVVLNDFLQVRTGVFTNLGNWKSREGTSLRSKWFGFPPVIKTQPFGAMTGSMNGEQSMSVVLHPSLTRSPEIAQECLERWKINLLKD